MESKLAVAAESKGFGQSAPMKLKSSLTKLLGKVLVGMLALRQKMKH